MFVIIYVRVKLANKNYESDLRAQIEHGRSLKRQALEEEQRQHEEGLKSEAAYQQKLKQVNHVKFFVFILLKVQFLKRFAQLRVENRFRRSLTDSAKMFPLPILASFVARSRHLRS